MIKDVICVDLFCGCGGLTKGLRDAGIQVLKGIDMDASVMETYERNNPGSTFVKGDVRHIMADSIMDGISRRERFLLLAGCAPCQPFSKHVMGSKRDGRRSLIRSMSALVEKILPEYVMVENVPKFGNSSNAHHAYFIRVLKRNGYCIDEGVVNAADYGVPQMRRRYVMLASRNGKIKIPDSTHGSGAHEYATVKDTIQRFPEIDAGESLPNVVNHTAPRLSKRNVDRVNKIPKDGGSRSDLPHDLWPECHRNHNGHTDTYGRMHWDKPAPTLTCRCTSLSNGRFGHPEHNRAISVREAAALQTFPDDYVFYSYKTANARHIGNAVPVLMAKKIGEAIGRHASRRAAIKSRQ